MRERLQAALREIQSAKAKMELCLREATEDPSKAPMRGTLGTVLENIRVSEVYLVRLISRLPPEEQE